MLKHFPRPLLQGISSPSQPTPTRRPPSSWGGICYPVPPIRGLVFLPHDTPASPLSCRPTTAPLVLTRVLQSLKAQLAGGTRSSMSTGGCYEFTIWQCQQMDTACPQERLHWILHNRYTLVILRVKTNTKDKPEREKTHSLTSR